MCREECFPSTATRFASDTIPIHGDPGVERPVTLDTFVSTGRNLVAVDWLVADAAPFLPGVDC